MRRCCGGLRMNLKERTSRRKQISQAQLIFLLWMLFEISDKKAQGAASHPDPLSSPTWLRMTAALGPARTAQDRPEEVANTLLRGGLIRPRYLFAIETGGMCTAAFRHSDHDAPRLMVVASGAITPASRSETPATGALQPGARRHTASVEPQRSLRPALGTSRGHHKVRPYRFAHVPDLISGRSPDRHV